MPWTWCRCALNTSYIKLHPEQSWEGSKHRSYCPNNGFCVAGSAAAMETHQSRVLLGVLTCASPAKQLPGSPSWAQPSLGQQEQGTDGFVRVCLRLSVFTESCLSIFTESRLSVFDWVTHIKGPDVWSGVFSSQGVRHRCSLWLQFQCH